MCVSLCIELHNCMYIILVNVLCYMLTPSHTTHIPYTYIDNITHIVSVYAMSTDIMQTHTITYMHMYIIQMALL